MLSQKGIDLIKEFEGLSLTPYLDPIDIPTIGYGSIYGMDGKRVTMSHRPITLEEAEYLLEKEVRHACYPAINRLVKVDLKQGEFDALCSFIYNLGSGNFQSSTLRMKLNRGDKEGAANEFPRWIYAGGRKLNGLLRRRIAEKAMFLS